VKSANYYAPHYAILFRPPVTFSLLRPSILLSTLFPNTYNLQYFLNLGDHVSHSGRTEDNISVLYISIYKFLIGVRVPKRAGNFSLHHRVETGSGAHPAS